MFAGLGVGQFLILLALVLFLLVLAVIAFRRITKLSTVDSPVGASQISSDRINTNTTEAVILVQHGGRVEYINQRSRDLFGLRSDEPPDLERLMRSTRPAEEFLSLCAEPGQSRLSIGGQLVEVTSYQLPGPYIQMLVAIKQVELSAGIDDDGDKSLILRLVTDFGRDISSSLELEEVLHAVLLNTSHLVSSDVLEIKTWDAASRSLTPYTLDPSGRSGIHRVTHSQFGGLTEHLIDRRKPFLVTDTHSPPPELANLNGNSPVQSYLGLPLMADNSLVGTLELGQLTTGSLGQHEFELTQLISSQIAHSLRNAMQYTAEQKRASELDGLASLVKAINLSHDYKDLIRKLLESAAPLLSADILGFLLYNEQKKTLEAQSPFQGLPTHIVDIYRTSIAPNSPAENIIKDKTLMITRNAANDPAWRDLGLHMLAQAASLRESVLAPMVSNGALVGYFQVSNHKQASAEFSEGEIRLIETVAQQAAGIIDTSVTLEATRKRAMRSDALRRIASLATSTASTDEILRYSLKELAQLFQGDLAAVFLYDERAGGLRLHDESIFGAAKEFVPILHRLHIDTSQYRTTVSGSQSAFLSGRLITDRQLQPFYRPLVTALQLESIVIVPLIIRNQSLGELILGSHKAEYFNEYDL